MELDGLTPCPRCGQTRARGARLCVACLRAGAETIAYEAACPAAREATRRARRPAPEPRRPAPPSLLGQRGDNPRGKFTLAAQLEDCRRGINPTGAFIATLLLFGLVVAAVWLTVPDREQPAAAVPTMTAR